MDRAFDLPQETRQRGIGLGVSPEERDVDAVGEILVHQHGDVLAVLQRLR
jgi:hypothetical protein